MHATLRGPIGRCRSDAAHRGRPATPPLGAAAMGGSPQHLTAASTSESSRSLEPLPIAMPFVPDGAS